MHSLFVSQTLAQMGPFKPKMTNKIKTCTDFQDSNLYYFGKYLMFHRTSWDLDLFFPPTGVVFRLAATSFADLLLWNSIQPSVNCLAILSFRFCFSFKSEKNWKVQTKIQTFSSRVNSRPINIDDVIFNESSDDDVNEIFIND